MFHQYIILLSLLKRTLLHNLKYIQCESTYFNYSSTANIYFIKHESM